MIAALRVAVLAVVSAGVFGAAYGPAIAEVTGAEPSMAAGKVSSLAPGMAAGKVSGAAPSAASAEVSGGASTTAAPGAVAAEVTADADLAARLRLAAVPGVRFTLAPAQTSAASSRVAPPACDPAPAGDPVAAALCDVNWKSMPESLVALPVGPMGAAGDAWRAARVLLADGRGQPLLLSRPGEVLLAVAPSPALRRWVYFNYVLHVAACSAAGLAPESFARWPLSPLPLARGRRLLILEGAFLWGLAAVLLRLARRAGRRDPLAAARFFAAANAAAPRSSPLSSSSSASSSSSSPSTSSSSSPSSAAAAWHRAGFARSLAGLLTLLAAMLLCIGPYFALQSLLATHVQPFPEADGLWRTTYDALFIAWMTFDMGTQTAFVKYFAEHRVGHPKDALADVQFYVWWQIFARLAEATLLCAVALGYLPYSRYALYAPFVILYSLCFLPSVSGIGKLMCQALQRFDYYNLLDMAETKVVVYLIPLPLVLLCRQLGATHPVYGEAFGAAIGLGLGLLATNLVLLGLGLWVLRHMGLPLLPLFLAQFTRATARRQLVFGVKLTLGQEPFRLTAFLESLIIIHWLNDFPTWLGIKDFLQYRLTWLYFFPWGFYQGLVPALSEALGAGKRRLAQYYVARYFQFAYLFTFAIFSLLMAVGPTFIRGAMGAQWGQAEHYLLLASLVGLLLPPAFLSDSLQQGAGRTGTQALVMLGEQGLRLGLYVLLIPRIQFPGIYVATLIALLFKAVLAWSVNHRRILPLRLPPWVTLGAPACAGAINYGLWRAVATLWVPAPGPTTTATVLALFLVAGAGSFFACFFACGLLGGFDPAALAELDQAARMSTGVRPLCLLLSRCAHAGARLSPLPGSWVASLPLAQQAATEAAALDAAAAADATAAAAV